jgi:hypothetical protein
MRHLSYFGTLAMIIAGSSFLANDMVGQTPDTPSIADAARQNREQKKASLKTDKVITNDTLSPAPPQPATSRPISPAAPAATSTAPDASVTPSDVSSNAASPAAEANVADSDKLKAELTALKQQFKDKQSEVDLLQRLLKLDQDAVQSKPDSNRDTDAKARLEDELNDLKVKQGELDELKSKLLSMPAEDPTKPEQPKP